MKFAISKVCSAFQAQTIGTKVVEPEGFLSVLAKAVEAHDTTHDRAQGQHFISLDEAIPYVAGGVGKRTLDTSDYVLRAHRERVVPFLKRRHALRPVTLAAIVYTKEAYITDCREAENDEARRIEEMSCTHVIVAILASHVKMEPLTPWRLVANLAGGNKEAMVWGSDEIRAKAKESFDFWSGHCVVSD
jgi:hypothetical protein